MYIYIYLMHCKQYLWLNTFMLFPLIQLHPCTHPTALLNKRSNAMHLPALLSEQGPSSVDRYQLAGKMSLHLHALCMVYIVKGVLHE